MSMTGKGNAGSGPMIASEVPPDRLTKEFIEQYEADTKTVAEIARAALRRYYELSDKYAGTKHVNTLPCLAFIGIEDGEARFEGDEYWSYGGHEHHYDMLPLAYLYDEDLWTRKEAQFKADADERERKAAEEAEKKRIAADKQKRAAYERLKAEFEGVATDAAEEGCSHPSGEGSPAGGS